MSSPHGTGRQRSGGLGSTPTCLARELGRGGTRPSSIGVTGVGGLGSTPTCLARELGRGGTRPSSVGVTGVGGLGSTPTANGRRGSGRGGTRPSSGELKRPGTTAEEVFERLVEAILSGEFPGGTPLREAQLARHWKVSRTPMREAVRRAAEAGFVVLRPNQTPLVRSLTAADIHDLYDLRELLELRALELAWPQFDGTPTRALKDLAAAARPGKSRHWPRRCLEFDLALHACWMKHCGNSWLTADLEWLYQFLRIIQSWIGRDHQALANAYAEHLAVLNAIKRRDKTAALDRLRAHIRTSAAAVTKALGRVQASHGDA